MTDISVNRVGIISLPETLVFGKCYLNGQFKCGKSFLADYAQGDWSKINRPVVPVWACTQNVTLTLSGILLRYYADSDILTSLHLIHTLVTQHRETLSMHPKGNLFFVNNRTGTMRMVKVVKGNRWWTITSQDCEHDSEEFLPGTRFFSHVTPATRLL